MAYHPIKKHLDGTVSWTAKEGDQFIVTGIMVDRSRFRLTCDTWAHARCINLWRGTVWLERDGKRYLIKRVWN